MARRIVQPLHCGRGTRLTSMDCDECHLSDREGQEYFARLKRWTPPAVFILGAIQKKKPAVRFTHKLHAERVRRCVSCHHKGEENPKLRVACSECHGRRSEGKKVELKEAFHKQCKDCHKREKRGPARRNECHRK